MNVSNKLGNPVQSMREEAENYRNNSPTTRRIQIKADNTTMTKDAWRNCYLLHSKSSVLMYPIFTVSSRFWGFWQELVVPRTVACFVTPLDYDWHARLFSSSMFELILALILQYTCLWDLHWEYTVFFFLYQVFKAYKFQHVHVIFM